MNSTINSTIDQWQLENRLVVPMEVRESILKEINESRRKVVDHFVDDQVIDQVVYDNLSFYLTQIKKNISHESYTAFDSFFIESLSLDPFEERLIRNKYGELKIQSDPESCEVHLNGIFLGYSKNSFMVLPGAYRITISLPRYRKKQIEIYIESQKRKEIKCKLEKQ